VGVRARMRRYILEALYSEVLARHPLGRGKGGAEEEAYIDAGEDAGELFVRDILSQNLEVSPERERARASERERFTGACLVKVR